MWNYLLINRLVSEFSLFKRGLRQKNVGKGTPEKVQRREKWVHLKELKLVRSSEMLSRLLELCCTIFSVDKAKWRCANTHTFRYVEFRKQDFWLPMSAPAKLTRYWHPVYVYVAYTVRFYVKISFAQNLESVWRHPWREFSFQELCLHRFVHRFGFWISIERRASTLAKSAKKWQKKGVRFLKLGEGLELANSPSNQDKL